MTVPPTPQQIKEKQLEIIEDAKAILDRAKANLCKIEDRINDSSQPGLSAVQFGEDWQSADSVPAAAVWVVSNQNTDYAFELT